MKCEPSSAQLVGESSAIFRSDHFLSRAPPACSGARSSRLPRCTSVMDSDGYSSFEEVKPKPSKLKGKGKAKLEERKRSSKACDPCRRAKCKCERTTTPGPCINCVVLGTPCTYLQITRKR